MSKNVKTLLQLFLILSGIFFALISLNAIYTAMTTDITETIVVGMIMFYFWGLISVICFWALGMIKDWPDTKPASHTKNNKEDRDE